jgi:peptidoglycan hydrolase-like protein with peptidoglycan-binding domain
MKKGIKNSVIAAMFVGLLSSQAIVAFAGYFNTTPITTCGTQITHTLQAGSENNDVYVLQQMLSRAGYLQANPNGYFGYATGQAVKHFQYDNYIPTTGTVGPTTLNAINERLCDSDLRGDVSYGTYGINNGTTYVGSVDPYVKVISPKETSPVLYATPQGYTGVSSYTGSSVVNNGVSTVSIPSNSNTFTNTNAFTPLTSQIGSLQTVIYNPATGYSYGIIPQAGSLTISSPVVNTTYKEGDTVFVQFGTNNLSASGFQVLLENTSTQGSKVAAFTTNGNTSFILTKELLDAVCSGACDNNQQGSFRVVVTTPSVDIAGNTSMFRAAVAPITIKRVVSINALISITPNKTPVDSNEHFRLHLGIPSFAPFDQNSLGAYSIKIRAVCPSAVTVSLAGATCAQDIVLPLTAVGQQQDVPVMITNPTWYSQTVRFEVAIMNTAGQTLGTNASSVVVNPSPFTW